MAILNVVKINICSLTSHLGETYLFACKSSADLCFQVSDMSSFGMSDLISQTKKQICTFSSIEGLEDHSELKFESMCSGKGIIKSLLNKSFLVYFKSPKVVCIICVQNSKRKLPKKMVYMDGYALSLFHYCLTCSEKYVDLVANYLSYQCYIICQLPKKGVEIGYSEFTIHLKEPERHVMDLTWFVKTVIANLLVVKIEVLSL